MQQHALLRRTPGEVWTSSGAYCLGGITRGNVLRVCREAGIPSQERLFSLTEVYSADEAFVTGTFAGRRPGAHRRRTHDRLRRARTDGARLQELYADLVRRDVAGARRP